MLQRVENLEENIASLQRLRREYTLEDIKANRLDEWALRYGLFESIQIVINLSCHLVAKYNLTTAKSYVECIESLQKHRYLSSSLAKNLIAAIGLRNLLVHEYVKIDLERLYGFLDLTDDFRKFIEEIAPAL